MNPIKRLFNPVRRAAIAFFRHDLALKREQGNLCIVLEERPAAPSAPLMPLLKGAKPTRTQAEEEQRRRRKQAEALVRQELRELLDQLPGSRQALRHLAAVEQAIVKKGFRALDKLPEPLLRKALEQLEGMVTNWSPVGLATLRSKMAVSLLQRETGAPAAAPAASDAEEDLDPSVLPDTDADAPTGEAQAVDDAAALAAAYAALGQASPAGVVEFQGELGSPSTRALAPPAPRVSASAGAIEIRVLEH